MAVPSPPAAPREGAQDFTFDNPEVAAVYCWLATKLGWAQVVAHDIPERGAGIWLNPLPRAANAVLVRVDDLESEVARLTAELEQARAERDEVIELVHALTDGELEWLEILGRGVDFDQPDFAVEHHTLGLDGSEAHVRFEGANLLDCLRKARAAKEDI